MQRRSFSMHVSNFTDRPLFRQLDNSKIRFFNRAGGAIRTTARRSLRKAPQVPLSELTPEQRVAFRKEQARYKAGLRSTKPRRRERIAQRGKPPLLHMKPKSPLREMLFYSIADDRRSVVVGPARFRDGNLQALENQFPFMAPAMATIAPKLPTFLAQATT